MAAAATATRQAGPAHASVAPMAPSNGNTAGPGGASPDLAQPMPQPWDGLDTRILADLARRGLMSTLDTIKEAKTLMLDPSLAGPLGLVADVSSLKQHGVEKMFWLEPASPAFVSRRNDASYSQSQSKAALKSVNAPTKCVVYICRPEIKWMKAIAGTSCASFLFALLLLCPSLCFDLPPFRPSLPFLLAPSIPGLN